MNARSLLDIRLAAAGAVAVHVTPPDLKAMQMDRAATLWAEGLEIRAIGEAIGVPVTTLRGWINFNRDRFAFRRGDKAPPRKLQPDAETLAAAIDMWAAGETQAAIGVRFGVSKNIVRRWMNENRDSFPYRRARANGGLETGLIAEAALAGLKAGGMQPGQQLAPPKPARAEFVAGFAAPLAPPKPGKFTLMQVDDRTCRWPISGAGADTRFCGCRILPGKIYCAPHRAQSSIPARPGTTTIRKGE